MNLPAHLMSDGSLYLQIIGLCLLPEAAALCRPPPCAPTATPARPCTWTLIVNLITFVGNLLLLYGWFGLPQLGAAGVAISTVAGRIVGWCCCGLVVRKTGIRCACRDVRPGPPRHAGQGAAHRFAGGGGEPSWMLQFMVVTASPACAWRQGAGDPVLLFQICLFILLFGLPSALATRSSSGTRRGQTLRSGPSPADEEPLWPHRHRHRHRRRPGTAAPSACSPMTPTSSPRWPSAVPHQPHPEPGRTFITWWD